jgi:YHS domain-containing protein
MKCLKTLGVAVTFILLVCAYTFAGDAKMKTMSQQICPVMTFGDIGCSVTKHDIYTDYNDKRIYFCSKGCLEKFKKDPEKYLKKAEEKGVQFEKVPVDRD